MSDTDPTVLTRTTRLPPAPNRSRSQSPSRSPVRKALFTAQEIDPLLGNLSPSTTLEALSLTEALSPTRTRDADILARSIAEAPTTERAHGIRAAVAAQKLREWHAEVSGWKWPAKKDRRLGKGFQAREILSQDTKTRLLDGKSKKYLGSLPAAVVALHEERIEEIKDGLEALNVEELKEHVLKAHIPSRSKDASSSGMQHGFVQLSDFTAVITHTMLQALPYLSKLTTLLNDWELRIIVLKQVPHLLHQLDKTQAAIENATENLGSGHSSELMTRARFEETKAVLGSDVSELGAILDRMLDLLEGREDSLPESWIDRMDKIESNFAQWAVEAERRVLFNEWMENNEDSNLQQSNDAEGPNAPGNTVSPDESSLLASPQPQRPTSLHDGMSTDHALAHQPEQLHDQAPAALPLHSDSESLTVAASCTSGVPDSLAAEPVSDASLTSDAQDGRVQPEEESLPVRTKSVHDLVASLRRPLSSIEDTSLDQEESPATCDPPRNQEIPNVPVSASCSGEQGHGLSESDVALQSDLQVAKHFHGKSNAAVSSLLAESPQEPQSSGGIAGSLPLEPVPGSMDQYDSVPLDQQSSHLVGSPQVRQKLTLSVPQTKHRREVSEVSTAGSMVSEAFSDISNAEIASAITAEAMSPKIIRYSIRDSRNDLSKFLMEQDPKVPSVEPQADNVPLTETSAQFHVEAAKSSCDEVDSQFPLPIKVSETVVQGEDEAKSAELTPDRTEPDSIPSDHDVIHRASLSSVKKIAKSRIRSIMVHRRDSSSSSLVSPISPVDTSEHYKIPGSARSISPLESRSSTSLRRRSSRRDYFEAAERKEESSPMTHTGDDDQSLTPTLPRRSSKRLSRGPSATLMPTVSTPTKDFAGATTFLNEPQDVHSVLQSWSPSLSPVKTNDNEIKTPSRRKGKGHEDLFESKIHSLLTRIPARIRLLSESDQESSPHLSTASSSRSQSPIPSIILSPVKPKHRPQLNKDASPNSDIRIFHLTRSTESKNTPPIKLFVRLVGEHGERVMVRVGGGWADLGDYLRDYSLYHSSKGGLTTGQFQLASLPANGGKVIPIGPDLISKATGTGPFSSKGRSPMNSRPGSALDQRPSAATPFGVLNAARRRRSASTMGRRSLDVPRSDQSSPYHGYSSDTTDSNTECDIPPVPHVRTLSAYHGGDPHSSGPLRQPFAPPSTNSPTTPTSIRSQTVDGFTPSTTSSHTHQYRHVSASAAIGSRTTAAVVRPPNNKNNNITITKTRTTITPSTGRISIEAPEGTVVTGGGGGGNSSVTSSPTTVTTSSSHQYAPSTPYSTTIRSQATVSSPTTSTTTTSTTSSSTITSASATSTNPKSKMNSSDAGVGVGVGSGIKRVFFRKKSMGMG